MCIWKIIFGIPCFACGMTRSAIQFCHGNFESMLEFHPLFPMAIIGLMIFALDLFKVRKIKASEAGVIYFFFSLVYFIRMILFFPDTPPMEFNSGNLFIKFFQGVYLK